MKNRPRSASSFKRKFAYLLTHDRVLIVCEGKKTEPNYFNEIRSNYRLSATHVEIVQCSIGTAPIQIVEDAKQRFRESKKYDRVYCVFHRDDHKSFQDALNTARSLNNKMKNDEGRLIPFSAIPSIPCFELWLLIHFQPLLREENRDSVFAFLKQELPSYEKGARDTFARTKDNLYTAYSNAEAIRQRRVQTNSENPYTDIDIVVKFSIFHWRGETQTDQLTACL